MGETADSLIFFPVAFGGIIAWPELLVMMCIQIVLKSLYEVLILPVTIRVVAAIKRIDGSDVYDQDISYNILKTKIFEVMINTVNQELSEAITSFNS